MEQVHRIVEKIYQSFDVSQAFDKVWHHGLFYNKDAIFIKLKYTIINSYLKKKLVLN